MYMTSAHTFNLCVLPSMDFTIGKLRRQCLPIFAEAVMITVINANLMHSVQYHKGRRNIDALLMQYTCTMQLNVLKAKYKKVGLAINGGASDINMTIVLCHCFCWFKQYLFKKSHVK